MELYQLMDLNNSTIYACIHHYINANHMDRFILTFYLVLHCLGVLPGNNSAIFDHLFVPSIATNLIIMSSSSLLHCFRLSDLVVVPSNCNDGYAYSSTFTCCKLSSPRIDISTRSFLSFFVFYLLLGFTFCSSNCVLRSSHSDLFEKYHNFSFFTSFMCAEREV